MEYIIENEYLKVTVTTWGAQVKSVIRKCDGVEHIWQADKSVWGYHAPILFPHCGKLVDGKFEAKGKLYESPQHGFARTSEHDFVSQTKDTIILELRSNDALSFWDKVEAVFLTLLSDSALRMGDKETAYRHLREARNIAQRFDTAPDYRTHVGLKFYHGGTDHYSLDDMGDTALLAIENTLERDACDETKTIWKEIKDEK